MQFSSVFLFFFFVFFFCFASLYRTGQFYFPNIYEKKFYSLKWICWLFHISSMLDINTSNVDFNFKNKIYRNNAGKKPLESTLVYHWKNLNLIIIIVISLWNLLAHSNNENVSKSITSHVIKKNKYRSLTAATTSRRKEYFVDDNECSRWHRNEINKNKLK